MGLLKCEEISRLHIYTIVILIDIFHIFPGADEVSDS